MSFAAADFTPAALTVDAIRARGEPALFETSEAVWKARLKSWFESETGRTVYPDQTEMLLIEMAAYAFSVKGAASQTAILQNTAIWAQKANLDAKGGDIGITRLLAQPARVTIRAIREAASAAATIVPAGTAIEAGDIAFTLDAALIIPAGQLAADGSATATEDGEAGNGFAIGDLTLDLAGLSLANITVSAGGSDEESDERLRKVIVDGPEAFDRHGGWGGYGVAVRRVSPLIDDVAIDRPEEGHIHVIPTVEGNEPPSQALLDDIAAALPHDTVRPHGDDLTVRAPTPYDVAPEVTIRIDPLADTNATIVAVDAAIRAAFASMRRPLFAGSDRTAFAVQGGRLGAQIAPGPIIRAAMGVAGVIDVTLDALAYVDLPFDQYPRLTGLTIAAVSGADQ